MGQPQPLFVYFPFSHQVESNSDRTDLSRPLYPLDHRHHHRGPWPNLELFLKGFAHQDSKPISEPVNFLDSNEVGDESDLFSLKHSFISFQGLQSRTKEI